MSTGRKRSLSLLVLHPLNERNIYANIKKLGKQKLVGSVSDRSVNDAYCILCKSHLSIGSGAKNDLTRHAKSQNHMQLEMVQRKSQKIHTEFRSDLNNDTICGLLSCKFNQNQCCYEYQPSASLLKSAKSATSDYNQSLESMTQFIDTAVYLYIHMIIYTY